MKSFELEYRNKKCSDMSNEEIEETSRLFSEHYGMWSEKSPIHPGKSIRMSPRKIQKDFVDKPDRYVALVYHHNKLVGHIFYLRRKMKNKRYITWILQLVVNKEYRGHQIGTKLMHSIFQLSDSYAWGLYTSNPMTIKTLENATMRKIDIKTIEKNLSIIKECAFDLFDDPTWIDTYGKGQVNTSFFTNHNNLKASIAKAYPNDDFPFDTNLYEGHEWLAFTFRNQIPSVSSEQLALYLEYSEEEIKNAYSSMQMERQPWVLHTEKEIDVIEPYLPNKGIVCDFGCGRGRHSMELASRGYNVTGVDFSATNIEYAKKHNITSASFVVGDVRKFKSAEQFDAILCLYDVIGSFPDEKDNLAIIKNAYKNLKPGGVFILTVMNMTLTEIRCRKNNNIVDNLGCNILKLLNLQSTNDMQSSGDVFDGKHILIDDSTGICYRKEKFFYDNLLPKEVVIRDRRYTSYGITKLLQKGGFFTDEIYYFSARDMSKPLRQNFGRSKEIFVVASKMPLISKIVTLFAPIPKAWKTQKAKK